VRGGGVHRVGYAGRLSLRALTGAADRRGLVGTASVSEQIHEAIAAAQKAASPGSGPAFAARAEALELLDIHVLDRLQYLEERASLPADLKALGARAAALRGRLEGANQRVLRRLRHRIRSGRYTPEGLKRALFRHVGPPASRGGYDTLDLLVSGLLGSGPLSEERAEREPEMVDYQPTPARAILTLIQRANIRPDDIVYDLGSGLGQVVILVALLSGAHARGIEFEPAYCEYAGRCARRLNVPGVDFIRADAREVPLAGGTVFFMYTPFRGALLKRVLEMLYAEAKERRIRVCTYGPCTAEIASASWLLPVDGRHFGAHEVAVFHSVQPGSVDQG
jgi:hypothetical protein